MRYPITIEPGNDTAAWGVVVPDLPGCFSAGDTLEDAMVQAEEAITGWIEAAIDAGQDIPAPSHIEALRAAHPEFEGCLWALVKVDPAMLDDTLERVNISLPRIGRQFGLGLHALVQRREVGRGQVEQLLVTINSVVRYGLWAPKAEAINACSGFGMPSAWASPRHCATAARACLRTPSACSLLRP